MGYRVGSFCRKSLGSIAQLVPLVEIEKINQGTLQAESLIRPALNTLYFSQATNTQPLAMTESSKSLMFSVPAPPPMPTGQSQPSATKPAPIITSKSELFQQLPGKTKTSAPKKTESAIFSPPPQNQQTQREEQKPPKEEEKPPLADEKKKEEEKSWLAKNWYVPVLIFVAGGAGYYFYNRDNLPKLAGAK